MSTLLYRSPNVVIDVHEWHAAVIVATGPYSRGHAILQYRWRPLSARPGMWRSLQKWQGPRPKRMTHFFDKYRLHIRYAQQSEAARVAALASMRGPLSGATLANAAVRRIKWEEV